MARTAQAKRVEPEAQADMFGAEAAPRAYVPKPEHVRNALSSLLAEMRAAKAWPWNSSMVRLHRERTFSYLCGHLPDREEAERWRAEIDAEIARLDAAA